MNTNRWMMSVALTASLLMANGAQAGDWIHPGAPGLTMKTLQHIWDKLDAQQSALHNVARQNSLLLTGEHAASVPRIQ